MDTGHNQACADVQKVVSRPYETIQFDANQRKGNKTTICSISCLAERYNL